MATEMPMPALQGALPAVPVSTQSSPQKEVSPEHCQRGPADQPCQAFSVLNVVSQCSSSESDLYRANLCTFTEILLDLRQPNALQEHHFLHRLSTTVCVQMPINTWYSKGGSKSGKKGRGFFAACFGCFKG